MTSLFWPKCVETSDPTVSISNCDDGDSRMLSDVHIFTPHYVPQHSNILSGRMPQKQHTSSTTRAVS